MSMFSKKKTEKELNECLEHLNIRDKKLKETAELQEQNKASLEKQEKIAVSKLDYCTSKDADLIQREQSVSLRELEAKNNFVKQQREAFKDAIETQLNDLKKRREEIDNKQTEIEKQLLEVLKKDGEVAARERAVKEGELKAENGFADKNQIALREIEKREEACHLLEEHLKKQETENLAKSEKVRLREKNVSASELAREAGFTEERTQLAREQTLLRQEGFAELEKNISEEHSSRLATMEENLSKTRNVFEKENAQLEKKLEGVKYEENRLESRKDTLKKRERNIEATIEAQVNERKKSFDMEIAQCQIECERLRDSIQLSSEHNNVFETLKRKLGDEAPEKVLLRLKTQEEELKNLRQELTERPTKEMQASLDRIQSENRRLEEIKQVLSEENESLNKSARESAILEMQIAELTDNKKSLTRRFESVDADNNRLYESLKRLQASYEREQDREARIRDIEIPYIDKEPKIKEEDVDELTWLDEINSKCIDYGLKFPRRILHAFHTSLKTSEWSPITVLAGVSGTGKSELPRLYSHFGGMNFLSLSVQPNWDSQESMLGFFNSIDNKFDARPVLRLLAQSQQNITTDYPYGLKDVLSLILMDEMNLAHVELYFAEFLSKLELRRGQKNNDVPSLDIKLGAGIEDYKLALGRNVLWVGTMNQDETTKSLSDKVLDRGILINFPRPTTLERRKKLKPLGDQVPLLRRKLWESWWVKKSNFDDEQILPYKEFVEEMNTSLAKVGRALGHRVWQSIEYYMSNYPDVLDAQSKDDSQRLEKAMKMAFEDQLVQKIMPKLRGIETRGKSKTDCLDKIRSQLQNDDYGIIEDFDLACEFGYGQFIWNSANYLKEDSPEENTESVETKTDD